jgi:hypothetical protein
VFLPYDFSLADSLFISLIGRKSSINLLLFIIHHSSPSVFDFIKLIIFSANEIALSASALSNDSEGIPPGKAFG